MLVYHVEDVPPRPERPLVLAIGKFDGIHIGHQAILNEAARHIDTATALAVMSFSPHPAWVLGGAAGYDRSLTPLTEKLRLLAAHGVDVLYDVHFTRRYAETTAAEFVRHHLGALPLKRVVVGFDFRFGRGGIADADMLRHLCAQIGIPVTVVPPVEAGGTKVSSSHIRRHLAEGRVEAAAELLGRPYSVVGTVVAGDRLGRRIGFPTANLEDRDGYVLPGPGVYAVLVEVCDSVRDGDTWLGVMNAGNRPTVGGSTFRMEVHLLRYAGDLYQRRLRVSFLGKLRDERRFPGLEELTQQIRADVAYVSKEFASRLPHAHD